MEVIEFNTPLNRSLSNQVFEFEGLFRYPLGNDQFFRIDHSPNPVAFYRAMGESRTYYVISQDNVIASISYVIRSVRGHNRIEKMAYLGDLKIHPNYQGGRVLLKIAKHLQPILEKKVYSAYGIVMDGTLNTPEQYTGRLGIAKFERLREIYILRFDTRISDTALMASHVSKEPCFDTYQNLSKMPFEKISNTQLRSSISPEWFSVPKMACGMLEDTRLAKRLFLNSGEELLSTHLSYFVYDKVQEGFLVIEAALRRSVQLGFPAMFLALSKQQMDDLVPYLVTTNYTVSKAAIYGTHKACGELTINTAEI